MTTPHLPPLDDMDRQRQLSIGRLLLLARRDFLARSQQRMHAHAFAELSNAFVSVLPYIEIQGTRSTDLAQRSGLTKQAVAKIVKQLEHDGLLTRAPDPTDGRAFLVRFTATGLERLRETRVVATEVEAEYADLLGAEAREQLRQLLLQIVRPPLASPDPSSSPPP